MALRIVKPESVRIDLKDGEWIEVKKELNYEEQMRMHGATLKGAKINPVTREAEATAETLKNYAKAKIEAYLLDWSLVGEDGKSVAYTPEMLGMLSAESVTEIQEAIEAHTNGGSPADPLAKKKAASRRPSKAGTKSASAET